MQSLTIEKNEDEEFFEEKKLGKSKEPELVCFVCTGNTCRSPMAAAILNHYGHGRYKAISAGTAALNGDKIAQNAVLALKKAGIENTPDNDYIHHTAQLMKRELAERCDKIVAISSRHMIQLVSAFPQYAKKIFVLPHDIPDPYLGELSAYERCLDRMLADILEMFDCTPKIGYNVRRGLHTDIERILEIDREAFSDPWSRETLESCFSDNTDIWVLEHDQSGVCGFAVLDRTLGNEAELHKIAIDTASQGKGLSKSLMKKLINEAAKRGVKRLMLEVRESNIAAISLYEKFGFVKVGTRPAYYRKPTENAVLMDLNIEEKNN